MGGERARPISARTHPHGRLARLALIAAALAALALLASATIAPVARAVPAYGRKYNLQCSACHTRFPRLNTYGERFLENAYQLPGTEDGGLLGKARMGALALDDVKNYLGFQIEGHPLRLFSHSGSSTTGGAHTDVSIGFPEEFELFATGTLAKNIGFYLEFEHEPNDSDSGVNLETAFVTFANLGRHQAANLRVGRFDPSAFFSFTAQRLQISNVDADKSSASAFQMPVVTHLALSPAALSAKMSGLFTRDGTNILPTDRTLYNSESEVGLDLYGRPFGDAFLYQIGLTNGPGERASDSNSAKDWYVMTRFDYAKSRHFSANLSGFGYFGHKNAKLASQDDVNWSRYGVGATVRYRMLDVYAAYTWDRITGVPAAQAASFDRSASGVSVEADLLVSDDTLLSLRYDQTDAGGQLASRKSSALGTVQVKQYLYPNIALSLQETFNLRKNEDGSAPERNLRNAVLAGLEIAF